METVKDPGLVEVLIPLLVIVFFIAVAVVLLYLHFQKNLVVHKLGQERMKRDHQSELLRASIEAQEEERKRIANDLHDELGAVLSLIRMNTVMLERQSMEGPTALQPGLGNVRMLADAALASMRSISHRLMPPQLEAFGLIKTLDDVVCQINNTDGLHIEFCAPYTETEMPWPVRLGLYRIVMELINNTMKHSGASYARVDINEGADLVTCHYTDNGSGLPDGNQPSGLGHKSIEGRIITLNGSFKFGTQTGGGFYANICIPLGGDANAFI